MCSASMRKVRFGKPSIFSRLEPVAGPAKA
jgi:hypothetical protein